MSSIKEYRDFILEQLSEVPDTINSTIKGLSKH